MTKPKVLTNCIANRYTNKNERIVEFSGGMSDTGGLISLRLREDGVLVVELYCLENEVEVSVSYENPNLRYKNYNTQKVKKDEP